MTATVRQVVVVASRAVGACAAVADRSWPHGEARVIEVRNDAGRAFIGKAHRRAERFEAELRAYRRWVPALGHRAPRLVAVEPAHRIIVMTKLDATHLDSRRSIDPVHPVHLIQPIDPLEVHRQAGVLLRAFHEAEPAVRLDGHLGAKRMRLDAWVGRAGPGVLHPEEVRFVEEQLAAVEGSPDPLGVPCHRDWQPRNSLIDGAGTLHAIDFEHARPAPWHEDLRRLWWDEWAADPELARAFFGGYGRVPTEDETRLLLAASMLGHLVTIVWAHEHGDAAYGAHARRCLAQARNRPDDRW